MAGLLTQPDKLCGLLKTSVVWTIAMLLGINITGCNLLKSTPRPAPAAPTPAVSVPAVTAAAPDPCAAQQREIERLQQLLAEKEALIRSQQIRQREQVKASQESTKQSSRIQVKLRQLPTQSGAAAIIAEVEAAIKNLKSSRSTPSEQTLQVQAQRLLDAATASYAKGDYAAAGDHAAQSRGLIDMVTDNRTRTTSDQRRMTVSFQVPIPLRAGSDSTLLREPRGDAAKLGVLKKDSALTAQAYQGDWLQVQTDDGRLGWVLNTLVEAQADDRP